MPQDISQGSPAIFTANLGDLSVGCDVCPLYHESGNLVCLAGSKGCTSEASIRAKIEEYYASNWPFCAYQIKSDSGWVFAKGVPTGWSGLVNNEAGAYAILYNKNVTYQVWRRWPDPDNCTAALSRPPADDIWTLISKTFRACPDGYPRTSGEPQQAGEIRTCFNGYARDLIISGEKEKSAGSCGTKNPCYPNTGVKTLTEPDFVSPTLPLTRYFHSEMSEKDYAAMGRGWSHTYSERLLPFVSGTWRYLDSQGNVERFHCKDAPNCSVFWSEHRAGAVLRPVAGGWELFATNGERRTFDDAGKLVGIEDRGSNYRSVQVLYNPTGQVDRVVDQQGRTLLFNYSADGLVSSVTLPSGDAIEYQYNRPASAPALVNWQQQLVRVIREDLTERTYHYEDQYPDATPRYEFLVTGVTDENGDRYSTFRYDDHGRPVSSELAGGAGRVTLNYTHREGEAENWTITELTRPLGEVKTYTPSYSSPFRKPLNISDSRGTVSLGYYGGTTWLASRTDREGNQTTYSYNDGLHETRRTEAIGTLAERIIETDWDNTINRVTERRESGQNTRYTYNQRGQVLTRTQTDTNTSTTRSWTTAYYESPSPAELIGQIKMLDGPRTDAEDITVYDYYSTDDPTGLYLKGDLHTITNALGQVTEYLAYDDNGRPLEIKDPNDVITTLSYHARGWILSRMTDGQTLSFDYDNTGNLTRVTQADGSFTAYEYDAAHRLQAIADNFNNRVEYTLDAAGNRVAENTLNDLGVLKRQTGRVYDQLNRLQKVVDGNLDETIYGYDNNNNRTSTRDAKGNSTTFEYDPLDRLVRTIDPALGTSLLAYDERDNRIAVTDPLGNTTQYVYDGLDNRVQLDSPDTGATHYEYDAAGNRTSSTDARGIRVDYTYDALDRLTLIDYADNDLDVTFRYDMGANGITRLTAMTDAAGTESYAYDARGNLLSVVRVIDTGSYTTSYSYNGADRLIKTVYPSGMGVDYTLDAAGRVIAVDKTVNGVTGNLVKGVAYEPFGPVSAFNYGNGLSMNAVFDQDYELDQIQSGNALSWLLDHDPNGNINAITDQNMAANSQAFGYDNLNRLSTATGAYGNETFEYDANGNRTRYLSDVVDHPYGYQPFSNRLDTQNGWSFNRDATGNRLDKLNAAGYGTLYNYAQNNRLSRVSHRDVTGDSVAGTYIYDGRGQRVGKTVAGSTTHFVYGQSGELLGEYKTDGSAAVEYVYLDGRPIAVYSNILKETTPPTVEIIVDNDNPATSSTGTWNVKTGSQQYGADYREAKKKGANSYRWPVAIAGAGTWDVYVWWVDSKSYARRVTYTILSDGGSQSDVETRSHKTGGGQWQRLGQYDFSGTADEYIEVSAVKSKITADAIRLVKATDPVITQVESTDFVHTDHLGTPRAVTNSTGTVIWRWDSSPFGDTAPREDPDGDGNTFTLNLRFPGQYFDAESGLNYNYFRVYDPATGRYITSDPIGLQGGLSTYLYVNANPLMLSDPRGLDAPGCDFIPDCLENECKLECCAEHDSCYADNNCTAFSWIGGTKECVSCNATVVQCVKSCGFNGAGEPSRPDYYCAKQKRFITIPGDFPDFQSAIKACST